MYTELLSILGLSFLLGIRHATDADHVVAITTIVAKEKRGILNSALIGILWGIGHATTVTLVAIPIIIYSFTVPPRLGLSLEFAVGLMLVVLGSLNLAGITSKILHRLTKITAHKHSHSHASQEHSHFHLHSLDSVSDTIHHLGMFTVLRPIVIGLVHGLAGSTAIALLILSTIHNPRLSVFYLFIFNIGVIGGMMIITLGLGTSITLAKQKSKAVNRYLSIVSGILSLAFGLYIMYQIGIKDGLFSSSTHWTPQ